MIRERRAGDIAANWCDASKAERMMGWKAQYDIADMCRDSWNWQSHNPNGFADASPTPVPIAAAAAVSVPLRGGGPFCYLNT